MSGIYSLSLNNLKFNQIFENFLTIWYKFRTISEIPDLV